MAQDTTVNDLILTVLQSTGTQEEKIAIINEIRKARPPLADRWLYRSVVWSLGFTVVATILCTAALKYAEFDLPQGVIAIGSASVGALAALITPNQHGKNQ